MSNTSSTTALLSVCSPTCAKGHQVRSLDERALQACHAVSELAALLGVRFEGYALVYLNALFKVVVITVQARRCTKEFRNIVPDSPVARPAYGLQSAQREAHACHVNNRILAGILSSTPLYGYAAYSAH